MGVIRHFFPRKLPVMVKAIEFVHGDFEVDVNVERGRYSSPCH